MRGLTNIKKRLLRVLLCCFAALHAVGCYNSFESAACCEGCTTVSSANTTIAHLHTLYDEGLREVGEDLIIEGTVSANDEFGNLFKSFVIEDGLYAVEILDGLYDSYVSHPLGARIVVRLNGLGLDRYMGVLRVGAIAPATSSYSLDYLGSSAMVDYYTDLLYFGSDPTPTPTTIEQAEVSIAGRLISIEGLQLHTEDGVEREWEGYALFRTAELDSIWCYTSSYADFAESKIPQGELTLSGIFEFGSTDSHTNQRIIKMRGESDAIY